MNRKYIEFITTAILTVLGGLLLFWWQEYEPEVIVKFSKPGLDKAPADRGKIRDEIKVGEFFKEYRKFAQSDLKGEWRSFRGNDSDNICKDGIKLTDKWPESGPNVIWTKTLGEGHAGAVIYRGYVYVLDYLEDEEADALRCFSMKDGSELWRRWYKVPVKRNHGKSRTVPAVTEKYLVTIGPKCHVMCVSPQSGDLLWTIDMTKDYGTTIPQWYTGQCPLIDDDTVILAPAGTDYLVIGVEAETGTVLWKTPNLEKFEMSHASIIPMTIEGKKMYVYSALGGTVGISAEKENIGKVLWQTTKWRPSVQAPSPVYMGDGKILLSAGYGAGAMTIKVRKKGGEFVVETLNRFKPKDALALEQQTAIYWRKRILGILPKDAGANRQQLVACSPDDISSITALSGRDSRFGLGPFIVADEKVYVLSDNGTLSMFSFDDGKLALLSQYRVLNGHDAWAPLAIADGKMVLRDSTEMICIDLQETK